MRPLAVRRRDENATVADGVSHRHTLIFGPSGLRSVPERARRLARRCQTETADLAKLSKLERLELSGSQEQKTHGSAQVELLCDIVSFHCGMGRMESWAASRINII